MDIKTAMDLTNESLAKCAKVKSGGLTCTLVTEAIDSDKSWEEIKDLTTAQTVQCIYPYIYLTFHGYPTEGKGIPNSICPQVQNERKEMQLHK